MFSKVMGFFLMLCIYQVIAVTYEEALKECKGKFFVLSNEPLDHFMEKGEFEAGKENLKCFFDCLAGTLGVKDADGAINSEALQQLAQNHTHCQELALFGSQSVLQQCAKPYKNHSDSCGKVYQFMQCAINYKNAAPKQ